MRNHLLMLFVGLAVFLIGIAWFYLETINFDIDKNLTNNFEMKQEVLEYEVTDDETFKPIEGVTFGLYKRDGTEVPEEYVWL